MGDLTARLWGKLPEGTRAGLLERLSPSELQSILLEVSHERVARITAAQVLRRWSQDRFVRPSSADPRDLVRTQQLLWDHLPERFAAVELSPVVPLGTCSAVAPIHQNNVLSTIRSTEVSADPTNALAIEAAARRRAGAARVDLATCQRVVRAQAVDSPGMFAHFQLFALVSTTRDTGSGRTEAALLLDHLRYWQAVLGPAARLTFTAFSPSAVRERIDDTVRPALNVPLTEDPIRTKGSGGYYDRLALGIGNADHDLGDGGFTRWTADLLDDAKERCLISCVSTERLAAVRA